MRLPDFMVANIDRIIADWEAFASTLAPAANTMTRLQLRDHAKQILLAIAADVKQPQTEESRSLKSKGLLTTQASEQTAAAIHGALRHASGFTLLQLSSEFRAMRASVLKLWMNAERTGDSQSLEEMARFNEGIDQALAESIVRYSDRVDRSRDIFLGILSHDLRTPLNAVILSGEILATSTVSDDKRIELASIIGRSATTMAEMIVELLEYTKASLGEGMPVALVPSDCERICRDALDEVRHSHPEREFRLDVSGELTGSFDPARLKQMLWNLLNNAFQHGAKESPVTLQVLGDSKIVTILVQNYGETIPPESLQSIFEPLVMANPDDNTNVSSYARNLGLGLYIANQIVLAHGGALTVESTEKGGTVFKATLPRFPSNSC